MARQSALLKYNRISQDILMDGCGSDCHLCIAQPHCEGCNRCKYNNCQKDGCTGCNVKCWRRDNLPLWLEDTSGLDFTGLSCSEAFSGSLPSYIPQIQNSAFGVDHPAYIVNIHRLLNNKTRRWCYRKHGIKPHFNIPTSSKTLLSFCSGDALLEPIWTNSGDWHNGESFWDGVASYVHLNGIDASFSIEFSCFSDAPRMDHLVNIKRNIISAHELSSRGVPLILDATIRTELDLERVLTWGKYFDIKWYVLNFQRTKPVPWLIRMIESRIDKVIEAGGSAIVSGLGDLASIRQLTNKYQNRIAITNTVVSMKTNYYREFKDGTWIKSNKPQPELFAYNLREYCKAAGL